MPNILVVGGGLLGLLVGGVAQAAYGRARPDLQKILLLVAILVAAGIAVLFLSLPGEKSRLPQLYCYLVSVMTGYVVAAMLEEDLRIDADSAFASPRLTAETCLVADFDGGPRLQSGLRAAGNGITS